MSGAENAGMASAGVPVQAGEVAVKLSGGGTAWVRRLRRSEFSDLSAMVSATNQMAQSLQLSEMVVRASVVNVDGVSLDGVPIVVTRSRKGRLALADRELFDAISGDDVAAIMEEASRGFSEKQQGK